MTSTGRIDRLHATLGRSIRKTIGIEMTVEPTGDNWKKAASGTVVHFDMLCVEHWAAAQRKRGGRCLVFPLNPGRTDVDDRAWANWHEEWLCEGRGVFDLIGAGWTFFWGVEGRLGQDQEVLRAEWDQVRHRGQSAAQPHWHLDTGVMTAYTRPRRLSISSPGGRTDLEDLTSDQPPVPLEEIGPRDGIQELDLSGMHLGMGGWQNDKDHPRCWQLQVADDCSGLVEWAERTLRSAIDQFPELRVRGVAL